MDRINDPSATSDRKFTDGDDLAGIEDTIVTDVWANGVQEELVGLIEAAGMMRRWTQRWSGRVASLTRTDRPIVDTTASSRPNSIATLITDDQVSGPWEWGFHIQPAVDLPVSVV